MAENQVTSGSRPCACESGSIPSVIQGYTGAHPSPTKARPAKAKTAGPGTSIHRIPTATSPCPKRIIWVSLNFIVANPEMPRPKVMPKKKMLAKLAALSAEKPLWSIK